jgi:AcrR family transcriptional regulator
MLSSDTYHHKDLRRELMDGALRVIAIDGLAGLSLRKVAASAGVSHAAPYHHFADKAALVRTLGYEGLRKLDDRMARAEAVAGDDPGERLLAIGTAYVLFSAESPAYFLAMGAPEMREPHPAEQDEEHGETWERLVSAVIACQSANLLEPVQDPTLLAIGLWSLVEGLARLWCTGPLSGLPQSAHGLEPLADSIIRAMFVGMRPTPALPAATSTTASAAS